MKPIPESSPVTENYWRAAAEGRFVVSHCNDCDGVQFPPRRWCRHCWSDQLDWVEASGTGRVLTFSVVHRAPSEAFETPYVLAVIKLNEGPQIMTNIINCDPGDVEVDMAVEVTFEKRGDSALPQFRPKS